MRKLGVLLATLVGAIVIIAGAHPSIGKAETISHFQTRVQNCLYGQFLSISPIAYVASGQYWTAFWAGYPYTGPAYGGGQRIKGGGNLLAKYGPDTYYYGWWYTTNADGTIQYKGEVSQPSHYRVSDENAILACV